MVKTFTEVSKRIMDGETLHISAAEDLLRLLPKGNWIGGSTECFMTEDGGKVTDELYFVNPMPYEEFTIHTYDEETISRVASDAYDNGFSIVIMPYGSGVLKTYAEKAAEFEQMFIKNVVGWISGSNPLKKEQIPIVVNGRTGEVFTDQAVVLHIGVPADRMVDIGIINIFEQDGEAPVIEFLEEGFCVNKCKVDGEEVTFADYIKENHIDTRLPLVGDYSGASVNISFQSIENGAVNLYAPVFSGIQYKMARKIEDYVKEWKARLNLFEDVETVFSCNCILNFVYGGMEGKQVGTLYGPITFGEIAYQLINQTLVYVVVASK